MQRLRQMRGHREVTHHVTIHLGLFLLDFSPAAHLHNGSPYGVVLFTFTRRMSALEKDEMRSFDFPKPSFYFSCPPTPTLSFTLSCLCFLIVHINEHLASVTNLFLPVNCCQQMFISLRGSFQGDLQL